MSIFRLAIIGFLGLVALASTIVCALLWVELDSNLSSAYYEVSRAATQDQMNQTLDKLDKASTKVSVFWEKLPGVQTKALYDVKMMSRQAQVRLSTGAYVSQVKGDLMEEYGAKDLMPWFPYGHIVAACIALSILVAVWPRKVQHNGVRQSLVSWR